MARITPVDAERLRNAFLRHHEQNTRRAYRADLEAYARWAHAHEHDRSKKPENVHEALADLLSLSANDAIDVAEEYKASMAGIKAHTFRRRLSTIRTFCAYVHGRGEIKWRLMVDSKVARTDEQAENATAKDMSGPDEEKVLKLRRMLKARGTPEALRNLAIVDLTYYRSLRRAELARLDIRHFDPVNGTVRVRGKARGEFEKLGLNEATVESISLWLKNRPGNTSGPLFVRLDRGATGRRSGNRLTENSVFLLLERLGKLVGCEIRPHGLRHTSITVAIVQAAKDGRPLTSVQRFARHKHFNTTAAYVNKVDADVQEVMDRMRT